MIKLRKERKTKQHGIKKVRNTDEEMQSLLDEDTERDNLPPVHYSLFRYESIVKYWRKHKELPVEVVDVWMLAWCIGQGNAYGRYCEKHFSHFLKPTGTVDLKDAS